MSFTKNLLAAVATVVATLSISNADVVITTDTVQNGGVLTVNPAGALVVHGATNPQLTMTSGSSSDGVGAVVVGTQEGGNGRLRIEGGSTLVTDFHGSPVFGIYDGYGLSPGHATLGLGEGSTGIVTVHGAGTSWVNENSFVLGVEPQSYGELNVEAGALMHIGGRLHTAQLDTASAAIKVTGQGSKLRVTSGWIGNSEGGSTDILIDDGAIVDSGTQGVDLAHSVNSTVSLEIRGVGSTWNEYGGIRVGENGHADVRIEDGGLLWARAASANIYIGEWEDFNDAGSGSVLVTGAGSTFRVNPAFFVGRDSSLIAEQGGRIIGRGFVGNHESSQGSSVIIRGPGSRWDGNAFIDKVGTLLVEQGGEVNSTDASAYSTIVKDSSSAWNVSDEFTVDAMPDTPGEVLIQNNAKLTVNGSTTIDPNATLTIDNAVFTSSSGGPTAPISGQGRLNIRSGSAVSFQSADIGTLEVDGVGSRASVSSNTSRFDSILLTSGGQCNISAEGVIVTGMTEDDVTQLVINGYNNGAWNGDNGFISFRADDPGYAIGVATNNAAGQWRGLPVAPGDQLVAATLQGDTDLSFTVDFNDLLTIAQNYGAIGQTTWDEGDFNYDDQINFNDLLATAQNYGLSALTDGSINIDQSIQSLFQSDWQRALASVPEPSTFAFLALTPLLTTRRRR